MPEPNWITLLILSIIINIASNFVTTYLKGTLDQRTIRVKFKKLADLQKERARIIQKSQNITNVYLETLALMLLGLIVFMSTFALLIVFQWHEEYRPDSIIRLLRPVAFVALALFMLFAASMLRKQVDELYNLRDLTKYIEKIDAKIEKIESSDTQEVQQ